MQPAAIARICLYSSTQLNTWRVRAREITLEVEKSRSSSGLNYGESGFYAGYLGQNQVQHGKMNRTLPIHRSIFRICLVQYASSPGHPRFLS